MAPIFEFGGTPSGRARRALRELVSTVLTARDDILQACADLASMTDDEIRQEIRQWIDDAREVPEVRRILAAYGF